MSTCSITASPIRRNVRANNARGAYPVVGTQGGQSIGAGRIALKWEPRHPRSQPFGRLHPRAVRAGTDVLIAAGLPQSATNPVFTADACSGDRAVGGVSRTAGWLPGKNGAAIPSIAASFPPASTAAMR